MKLFICSLLSLLFFLRSIRPLPMEELASQPQSVSPRVTEEKRKSSGERGKTNWPHFRGLLPVLVGGIASPEEKEEREEES